MKKKIYLVSLMMITLIFAFFIGYSLENEMGPHGIEANIIFWTIKIIAHLLLVAVSIYLFIKKEVTSNDVVLTVMTIVFQVVPLISRLIISNETNPNYFLVGIVGLFSALLYVGGIMLLDLTKNKKEM
ncbi:MAG: hypothetical protein ACOX02_01695 [Acholeplasmatales bacterium]